MHQFPEYDMGIENMQPQHRIHVPKMPANSQEYVDGYRAWARKQAEYRVANSIPERQPIRVDEARAAAVAEADNIIHLADVRRRKELGT